MRVLGVSFGKKMGNTDMLLKEALMGAQEAGAEVALLRALDFNIGPCDGCNGCHFKPIDDVGFPVCSKDSKDDLRSFMEHFENADAYIFASPIYQMSPTGFMRMIADRTGSRFDIAILEEHKANGVPVDPRLIRTDRVGGFICVGGAERKEYVNMALPMMNMLTYPHQIEIVDQLLIQESILPGHIFMYEDKVQRAHELGKHVAESAGKAKEDLKWYGEEGFCPVCHNNLMVLDPESNKACCAVCGIYGDLSVEGGKVKIDFPKEVWEKSRLTMTEKAYHSHEIFSLIGKTIPFIKSEASKHFGKYAAFQVEELKPAVKE